MPRFLVKRLRDDTVSGFLAAAIARNSEAEYLARAGHGTVAIYLWGYVAEMTLKAAYFSLLGFNRQTKVTRADLQAVKSAAKRKYQIDLGNFHNVFHWAKLLIYDRIALGQGYSIPGFDLEVTRRSESVHSRWRETLRYKTNRPYEFEVKAVRDSAQWLLHYKRKL
jgi:hypothetical protein